MLKNLVIVSVLSVLQFQANASEAIGLGFGTLNVPHYWGSAEHYNITAPFPFVLEDKDTFLKEDRNFYIDFDGNFNFPVSGDRLSATEPSNFSDTSKTVTSSKSYARRGMGYLPPSIYIGAKLGVQFAGLALEAGITPGIQMGNSWNTAGLVKKISLKYFGFLSNSSSNPRCLCLYAESWYTDKTYNDLYYSVSTENVLSDRPAFDAKKEGYLGSQAGINYIHGFGSVIVLGFVNVQKMENSAVKDSPLLKRETNTSFGAGLVYMF